MHWLAGTADDGEEEGEHDSGEAQPAATRGEIKSYSAAYNVGMRALSFEKRVTQAGPEPKGVVAIWQSQLRPSMVTHLVESVARFLVTKEETPELYTDRKGLPLAQIAVLNPAHALYRMPTVRGEPGRECLVSCGGLLTRPPRGNFTTCMKHWDCDSFTLKPEHAAQAAEPEEAHAPESAGEQLPHGWQVLSLASGVTKYFHAASGTMRDERPTSTPPLPEGWEEMALADCTSKYYHTASGKMQVSSMASSVSMVSMVSGATSAVQVSSRYHTISSS